MSFLFVMCGCPASGKTTLSKKISEQYDAERYSFDEMGCYTHAELIPHIKTALKSGKSVVVDSTYSREKVRSDLLDSLANIECRKILVVMTTPLDLCISRNERRPNNIPRFMVEAIYDSMQAPALSEGWDEIKYV